VTLHPFTAKALLHATKMASYWKYNNTKNIFLRSHYRLYARGKIIAVWDKLSENIFLPCSYSHLVHSGFQVVVSKNTPAMSYLMGFWISNSFHIEQKLFIIYQFVCFTFVSLFISSKSLESTENMAQPPESFENNVFFM